MIHMTIKHGSTLFTGGMLKSFLKASMRYCQCPKIKICRGKFVRQQKLFLINPMMESWTLSARFGKMNNNEVALNTVKTLSRFASMQLSLSGLGPASKW